MHIVSLELPSGALNHQYHFDLLEMLQGELCRENNNYYSINNQ